MGFNNTATTITLTAKLTPLGRQKLLLTENNLITSFSIGDSDANYFAALPLTTGQVPSNSGNIGTLSTQSNSVGPSITIKNPILLNSTGETFKSVSNNSLNVTTDLKSVGQKVLTGITLTHNIIDRNDTNTDPLVNLYYSFNLPVNSFYDQTFTATTSLFGGYSDTGLSGLAQTKILVIGIDNSQYGEIIDGKTIKVDLTTTSSTYTLYSTFQNTGQNLQIADADYSDKATTTNKLGQNIALLFSDQILQPNGGVTGFSWSTGYNTTKPFSMNQKKLYNLTTNTNLGLSADTAVGIAYLDKGFIVITHPTIVNNFDITGNTSATTVTFDSLSTTVAQNITCIIDRGEFNISTNPTFVGSDTVRITEIGLYDFVGDLIAVGKTDRQIVKGVNEFIALGIKIYL